MLLGPEREGVHIDTLIRAPGVRLVRLDPREVGSLTLREAVLAVELELGRDDGVGAPAVEVKGGLGEDEGAGIRDTGVGANTLIVVLAEVGLRVLVVASSIPISSEVGAAVNIERTSIVEEAVLVNVGVGLTGNSNDSTGSAESVDRVRESIEGIGVVEGLGSKNLEERSVAGERRAVINILIGLDNPDKLLHGVVEVELDLVGGGPNRLVASELELSDEVLVGVLGHAAALVRVKEDIIDIERRGNEGLVVGDRGGSRLSRAENIAVQRGDRPEALVNGPDVKVDLDLVVLKSDQGESQTGVGAEPELQGDIQSRLREGVAGSANLAGRRGVAGAINVGERRVRDEGKLGRVTNHLEVPTLLLLGHRELVPDVHPVSVLAIDALASNLNLNLSDELLAGEIQPASIDTGARNSHVLVDLRESNLEIGAVSKISVPADHALDTATEIGLSVESLLDRLNREVRVPAVRHLPESNLRVTSKVNILSAIGYELHKTTSHFIIYLLKKKNFYKTN